MKKEFLALYLAGSLALFPCIPAYGESGENRLISVDTLTAYKNAKGETELAFADSLDDCVKEYRLLRRKTSLPEEAEWTCIAQYSSDGVVNGDTWTYLDHYETDEPVQYQYQVEVVPEDGSSAGALEAAQGNVVCGSNCMICLDPGHYAGENAVYVENSAADASYAEGDFTLEVALKLKELLEKDLGIGVRLTRNSGSITIDGYTDGSLDQSHISLRGTYAEGCDMFLSIHTNANLDGANGYPTQAQPTGITKTLVIVNRPATTSPRILAAGNAIGRNLSRTNHELGISERSDFRTALNMSEMQNWSDAWNDALDTPGAVCYRISSDGVNDYYGVLRGAALVNVPGMIVEHAYHSVPAMRVLAAGGELSSQWAQADAEGIAEGLGFCMLHQ